MTKLHEVSDGDNTYMVPGELLDEFNENCTNPHKDGTDEWYDWCDEFDKKWGEYHV